MKEDKPGWQKAEPVDMVYVKYDSKNNLPTHEATLPNKIDKEAKALEMLFVSLTRLTKNSLLHRKSYSNGLASLSILLGRVAS